LKRAKWIIKDSGKRKVFKSGMVRDTADDKIEYWRIFIGPLLKRYAAHITKGAAKYPDPKPGVPNWTRAVGEEELLRFRDSLARHFFQYMNGELDEDHASAVVFNLNGAEYVKERMKRGKSAVRRKDRRA